MRTAAQIAASRRNSLRSTGPRTAAGKAICRRNALKHGLRAAIPVASAPDAIAGLTFDFQPTTEAQRTAIRTISIAVARWRIVEELTLRFLKRVNTEELEVGEVARYWDTLGRYDGAMNLQVDRAFNFLFASSPDMWARLKNQQHPQLRSYKKCGAASQAAAGSQPATPACPAAVGDTPTPTTSPAPFVQKTVTPRPPAIDILAANPPNLIPRRRVHERSLLWSRPAVPEHSIRNRCQHARSARERQLRHGPHAQALRRRVRRLPRHEARRRSRQRHRRALALLHGSRHRLR